MTTFLGRELAALRSSRLAVAGLVAVLIIPLLYAGTYLWAFWDPTASFDRLPAAIVNADTAATVNGQELTVGADLAQTLVDGKAFEWHVTTEAEARRGLLDGDYSFALVIPEGFSQAVASVGDATTAEQANLTLLLDSSSSYITSTIATRAAAEIRTSLATEIGTQDANALLIGLANARTGISDAATGAGTLATGAATLETGVAQLATGSARLTTGAAALNGGAASAASGAAALSTGLDSLASGAETLAAGASTMAAGTTTLPAQTKALADGSAQVAAGTKGLATALTAVAANPALDATTAAQLAAIAGQATALSSGADSVAAGNAALAAGTSRLTTAAAQVSTGASKLATAADSAATGGRQVSSGVAALASGTATLEAGSRSLSTGAAQAAAGAARVASGASQLATSLREGATSIPALTSEEQTTVAGIVASPVGLTTDTQGAAGTYGVGFAPYFIGLSLWVGAVFAFGVLRPVALRRAGEPLNALRRVAAGSAQIGAVAVAQAVALAAVLHFGLGLDPARSLATLGFMVLVALSFSAVVQMLHAVLGNVARLVSVIFLVLQLAASAGTYPIETSPAFFEALHPFMPLAYVVTGLRHLISGGSIEPIITAVTVLVGLIVGSLIVTWVTTRLGREKNAALDFGPAPALSPETAQAGARTAAGAGAGAGAA